MKKNRWTAIALAVSVIAATSLGALAETAAPEGAAQEEASAAWTVSLERLVRRELISSEQAEAVRGYFGLSDETDRAGEEKSDESRAPEENEGTKKDTQKSKSRGRRSEKAGVRLTEEQIGELLKAGILTQEEHDAICAYAAEKAAEKSATASGEGRSDSDAGHGRSGSGSRERKGNGRLSGEATADDAAEKSGNT
ncbi:MAG: hypothetical protein IJH78_02385 [Clostridia bacterium]|nr:hypothetical protein [Clostridia bacterium]